MEFFGGIDFGFERFTIGERTEDFYTTSKEIKTKIQIENKKMKDILQTSEDGHKIQSKKTHIMR